MADYGYAPYKESALKSAVRLLAAGARGAGYGYSQAPDPASAFGNSFAQEYRGANAASQAAQEYAAKQGLAQRQQEKDALTREFMQAEIENMKKPPKPEKPVPTLADKRAEAEQMLGRPLTDDEARKLAGVHFNPPKPAAGLKPEKPPKPAPAPKTKIPAGLHKTEGDLLREIDWTPKTQQEAAAMPDFIKHLTDIMAGRAGYDSPALRRAAQLRLNDIQRQAR